MTKTSRPYPESVEVGDEGQKNFQAVAQGRGLITIPATRTQDMLEHWDFIFYRNGVPYKVDVKARKKMSRSDRDPQDKYIWIELHGVGPRNRGWLYGGSADLIAFERAFDFVLVRRLDLIKMVEELVTRERVETPSEAVYKIYSRPNRSDLITLVETEKLFSLTNLVWKKGSFRNDQIQRKDQLQNVGAPVNDHLGQRVGL